MNKLERLQAELKTKMEERKAEIAVKIETTKIESKLALLDNDNYVQATIKKEQATKNLNTLKTLMDSFKALPVVRNSTLGEVKVQSYALGKTFFGEEISHVLGVLNTLKGLFLEEHIDTAYSLAKISPIDVEEFYQAFGTPAYYSNKHANIVQAIEGDYELAKLQLETIATTMGLDIDINKFTKAKFDLYYKNEQVKSERRKLEIDQALELASSTIAQGEGKLTLGSQH